MKISFGVASLVVVGGLSGCGAGAKAPVFDPSQEVDLDGYEQNGQRVDRESLYEGLRREEVAGPLASRARTLAIVANVFAASGGALVGWTLGQHWGGDPNPPWTLAYVGGGLGVTGLGLALWSDATFNDAVKAHNTALRAPTGANLEWRGSSMVLVW